MYDYIKGTLVETTPAYVVIDNQGVGYFIAISLHTYSQIEQQKEGRLYVKPIIREDAHRLFGFADKEERTIFEALIGVTNVGPNSAMTILSTYAPAEIRRIIAQGELQALKSVKGIGVKTAQRILIDLKDKLGAEGDSSQAVLATNGRQQVIEEATHALLMLGFNKSAINKTLNKILEKEPETQVESLIKKALKSL